MFCFLACKCSKVGSNSENCLETGQCLCKDLFTGMQCSICQKGYYLNETLKKCVGKY